MRRRPTRDSARARALLFAVALLAAPLAARAQQIDLSHGGPITVTATDGIDWHQAEQTIVARGDAKAVRDTVTVTADVLIARYRKKACTPAPGSAQAQAAPAVPTRTSATAGAPAPPPPPCPPENAAGKPAAPPAGTTASATAPGSVNGEDTGNNEIYRLEAVGRVHIFTATDQAWGDHAVYDIDQAVLVLTGRNLKLVTPQDTMTARDSMEYWSQQHMAVGRGDAVVVTNDGRRVAADVLVGYTTPGQAAQAGQPAASAAKPGASPDPLAASGKLQKVDAFGHVVVRTATETVQGDRGVYVPDTGIARVAGNVRITRGDNQLNGNEAEVDMKTGLARLIATPGTRVKGLVVPQEAQGEAQGPAQDRAAPGPGAPAGNAPGPAVVKPPARPVGGRP